MNKIMICALSALLTFSMVGCTDNSMSQENQEVKNNQENNQSQDTSEDDEENQIGEDAQKNEDSQVSEDGQDNQDNQASEDGQDNQDIQDNIENKSITGYIVFEDNKVIINEVEIIDSDDADRIEELGPDAGLSFPSGYDIYNPDDELIEVELSADIIYEFIDTGELYIKDHNGKPYQTNKLEEFYKGSSHSEDVSMEDQSIPYFIDIEDGKVVKITENFIYTI